MRLIFVLIACVSGFGCEDCSKPLILTPYIENGEIEEARDASRITHPIFCEYESYSGYFTVDKFHKSNLFFWYVPNNKVKDIPLVVWLQGGPGASSLYGLFLEIGPYQLKNGTITNRDINWTPSHSLLFIDNPVGTGFSFTETGAFARNETIIGEHLYEFMLQFAQMFEIGEQKVFVAGESYGGKYAPALTYAIHKNNPSATIKINLGGMIIGDGWSDPVNQYSHAEYLHQIGLLDLKTKNEFLRTELKGFGYIKAGEWLKAYELFNALMDGDDLTSSVFKNVTGFTNYFNLLYDEADDNDEQLNSFLNRSDIKCAIHAGNIDFGSKFLDVLNNLKEDVYQSVAPWISELLSHYRVLLYSGQLDIIIPYPVTENYLTKLNFSGATDYLNGERRKWYVDKKLAGYVKTAGNLTDVLVRNAGHLVPIDQPKWAADLIQRFTYGKPIDYTNKGIYTSLNKHHRFLKVMRKALNRKRIVNVRKLDGNRHFYITSSHVEASM